MMPLPGAMVPSNRARLTLADHHALPITIPQIEGSAQGGHTIRAGGIDIYMRDETSAYGLDSGLYREVLYPLSKTVPQLYAQVKTQVVGSFGSSEQRTFLRDPRPEPLGGNALVEFKSNCPYADFTTAAVNAERVAELVAALASIAE